VSRRDRRSSAAHVEILNPHPRRSDCTVFPGGECGSIVAPCRGDYPELMATRSDVRRIALSFPEAREQEGHFAFEVCNGAKYRAFAWV
jgi:hypothetical protein